MSVHGTAPIIAPEVMSLDGPCSSSRDLKEHVVPVPEPGGVEIVDSRA